VENRSLEVERLSRLSNSLFTSAESTKVFHCFGHSLSEQSQHNTATAFAVFNLNVEENFVGNLLETDRYKRED
jgi:hypothetical protein